ILVAPHRLGDERLPREFDRLVHFTQRSKLGPEIVLAQPSFDASSIARRNSDSAPRQSKSTFRSTLPPGKVRGGELGRKAQRGIGRCTRLRGSLLRRRAL